MSSAVLSMTEALVGRARAAGATKPEAIARAARLARVSPGAIEGVLRGRVKGLKLSFAEGIRSAFIHETAREIERLRHDLEMARAAGLAADAREVRAARAAMARLRAALDGEDAA